MSQRIIFGGPSEVFPEEYPTHPSLVTHGYGEHSAHNPDYHHYAGLGGGVAYAQAMPASAQRDLVYNANQDMEEAFVRDGIPRRKQPGAMGSYLAEGSLRRDVSSEDEDEDGSVDLDEDAGNVRRGHQIYLGSSMKQRERGDYEVVLEPSLHDELAGVDGNLPAHRRNYQCAEPGLISEHRYNNASSSSPSDEDDEDEDSDVSRSEGGRFYVQDRQGTYLPPCGHDPEYGCAAMCAITGDEDLGDDSDFDSD